jgi:hypothetical protein
MFTLLCGVRALARSACVRSVPSLRPGRGAGTQGERLSLVESALSIIRGLAYRALGHWERASA